MRLKSLAGRISVHGILEDDKILFRDSLSNRQTTSRANCKACNAPVEGHHLAWVVSGIGARLIELVLGEPYPLNQVCVGQGCVREFRVPQDHLRINHLMLSLLDKSSG